MRLRVSVMLRYVLPWVMLVPIGVGLTALELHLRGPRTIPPAAGTQVVWTFVAPKPGAIISTPAVLGDRVYVGAIRDSGLTPGGVVYALDADTGREKWSFDAGGEMLHMYSSPCLSDGRLYIGEGMHANLDCKLTCLDVATARQLWRFPAKSHIESTPVVDGGRVFFGAGDDGVFALDAISGKKLWQFEEQRHVDSTPAIAGGRVFVGSGGSRRYPATELFALDAATGKPVWRVLTELPVWGSPVVDGGWLFVGLGNGRLDRSDPRPAGMVLCLDAQTKREIWRRVLPDAVFARVAIDSHRVYFGCRDGGVYAVARDDGRVEWRYEAGSPVVTAPALQDGRLYVIAGAGRVARLDAQTGRELAVFDLATHTGCQCRLYSSPVVRPENGGSVRVWFGAEIRNPAGSEAVLYCVRF